MTAEPKLAKVDVVSSNLITRSNGTKGSRSTEETGVAIEGSNHQASEDLFPDLPPLADLVARLVLLADLEEDARLEMRTATAKIRKEAGAVFDATLRRLGFYAADAARSLRVSEGTVSNASLRTNRAMPPTPARRTALMAATLVKEFKTGRRTA